MWRKGLVKRLDKLLQHPRTCSFHQFKHLQRGAAEPTPARQALPAGWEPGKGPQRTSKPQQLLNHLPRGSGQSLLPLFAAILPQQQGAEQSEPVAVQAPVSPGRWHRQDKPRRVLG